MQAQIDQVGEVVVVHLSGRVDVETAVPFREACLNHLIGKKIVFDFTHLSFVGSSGILPFLETMQEFASRNHFGFKFSGVGSEFKKVFAATSLSVIELYESHRTAVLSFANPPRTVTTAASLAVQAVPRVPSHTEAQVSPLGLRMPPPEDENLD